MYCYHKVHSILAFDLIKKKTYALSLEDRSIKYGQREGCKRYRGQAKNKRGWRTCRAGADTLWRLGAVRSLHRFLITEKSALCWP